MALKSNALALLSAAKSHLDIPVVDTTQDAKVERFINTASQVFENYCKRKLTTATYTQYVDGRSSNRLMLKEWPVLGGAAAGGTKPEVFIDSSSEFGSGTELDPAGYYVANTFELLRIGGVWPKGNRNIKVIYNAGLGLVNTGLQTNTLPSDLEQACLDYVLWLYDSKSDRRIGRNTKTKGDESVSFETGMPATIAHLLEPYVRHDFTSDLSVGVWNE